MYSLPVFSPILYLFIVTVLVISFAVHKLVAVCNLICLFLLLRSQPTKLYHRAYLLYVPSKSVISELNCKNNFIFNYVSVRGCVHLSAGTHGG